MKSASPEQGAALITSLWISLILLVLAMAYLSLLSADYQFTARQGQKVKAFYLARAGMEYFAAQQVLPSPEPGTREHRLYFPQGQRSDYCVIEPDEKTGGYVYKGTIAAPQGRIFVQRVLVCPRGDIHTWYERK
jgi:hypothetical protein